MFRCLNNLFLIGCAALVVIACPRQAQGQDFSFVSQPSAPVASRPFQLIFSGSLVAFFPSDNAADRTVTIDGDTIRVVQKGGLIGIPVVEPYLASVEVGPLPEGIWHVELEFEAEGTPPPLTFSGTGGKSLGTVTVGAPYRIEGPEVGYSSRTLAFTISRVDICSELGDITVDPDPTDGSTGGTVTIPWSRGCPILPEPAALQELETGGIGPLSAGNWNIDVVDGDGHLVAQRQLEVLPDPVILQQDRFRVETVWFNDLAADDAFPATRPTEDSALFAFFAADNWEVMVKVLDGCDINNHYWVFTAANTNQGYDILVTDTVTGTEWEYHNPLGTASPAETDIEAFPCDAP